MSPLTRLPFRNDVMSLVVTGFYSLEEVEDEDGNRARLVDGEKRERAELKNVGYCSVTNLNVVSESEIQRKRVRERERREQNSVRRRYKRLISALNSYVIIQIGFIFFIVVFLILEWDDGLKGLEMRKC